jgi:hypothetical protein
MKKTMINNTHIEGVLYEHDLQAKVSGDTSKNPGTPFITGTISIATDDAMTNIVPIHFTYVTATFGSGKPNDTYTTLNNIVNGTFGSYMKDGAEKAVKLRVDSALGLNEFFTERNGKEELVSAKRNEGGFVHIVTDDLNADEKARSFFKADMLITGTRDVEANPERNLPAKLILKGYIFDFRNAIMPVEFSVLNPNGMKYFANLDVSERHPVLTTVWGNQVSQTTYREITEESAFGEAHVRKVPSSVKDYVVTGTAKEPALWDDEDGILASEFNEAMANREVYLATVKQRQEEYQASRKNAAPVASTAKSGYNF